MTMIEPITTIPPSEQQQNQLQPVATAAPEFVAVILASSVGTRLFPLTTPDLPKHALPVVGQPIVVRLLQQLIVAGFCRAIVVMNEAEDISPLFGSFVSDSISTTTGSSSAHPPDSTSNPTAHHHHEKHNATCSFQMTDQGGGGGGGGRQLHVSIVRIPNACPSNIEALRIAMEYIPSTSHTVVLPGDLIVADAHVLKDLVHLHRKAALTAECQRYHRHYHKIHSSSSSEPPQDLLPPPTTACTILLTDVGEVSEQGIPLKESAKQKKGLLSREEEEIDYILRENTSSRLLWKQPKVDVEEDKDGVGATPKLNLPKARLTSLSTCTLRLDWSDVHVYCLAPWVRQLLLARPSMLSIQNDLLPLLISRQFRGIAATFGANADPALRDEALALVADQQKTTATSSNAKQNIDDTAIRSYAVLAHVAPNLVFRSNTVAAYLYANKFEQGHAVPSGATYNAKFRATVLPHCTIGDKVTFQSTVVGSNCTLGAKCRLNNVVLMDEVVVGDNTILQNTIVGRGSIIGENCNLNDCQLAPHSKLPAGTKKKSEAFLEGDFATS
jgi:NDP-sugar pyrophosphorylase family protein